MKKTQKSDPLNPPLGLLVKLGSIAVHCEEMLSPEGHSFDKTAIEQLLNDSEVQSWIKAMALSCRSNDSLFMKNTDAAERESHEKTKWIQQAAAKICSAHWVLQDCQEPIASIIRNAKQISEQGSEVHASKAVTDSESQRQTISIPDPEINTP